MERRIRLTHTDSKKSIDRQNYLDIQLGSSNRKLPYTDIADTVDSYTVFLRERNACTKFRLILTINPFCTNILFNPLTEMVNYGEDDAVVFDDEKASKTSNTVKHGLRKPTRVDMVRNTEYSLTYTYLPGFDIFDNHILRNRAFKSVNYTNKTNNIDYNTISDKLRTLSGKVIRFYPRTFYIDSAGDTKANVGARQDRHLYKADDLMTYRESVMENLAEDNGWFGFINKSNIDSVYQDSNKKYQSLGIDRVINSAERCDFIDMYPDRTLFSFNPKYNDKWKRNEYNWDITLTYPYKNEYNNKLVSDGDLNAVSIKRWEITNGVYGQSALLFVSSIPHGLDKGGEIQLYYKIKDSNQPYYKHTDTVIVRNIGDISGDNRKYAFYLENTAIVDTLKVLYNKYITLNTTDADDNDTSTQIEVDNDTLERFFEFRFTRVYNGQESEYYFRIFKKLPNLLRASENIDEWSLTKMHAETVEEMREQIDTYVNEYVKHPIDKEVYPLGFANTIYNDRITQVVFTDTIDTHGLIDNLGRPVTEFYVTIVKRHVGTEEWYGENDRFSEKVEFSHCFNTVTSGLDLGYEFDNSGAKDKTCDIHRLTTPVRNNDDSETFESNPALEMNLTIDGNNGNNMFYGDLSEFNRSECIEHVLTPVYHRFNTWQRDNMKDFTFHEMEGDDNTYVVKTDSGEIDKDSRFSTGFVIETWTEEQYPRSEGYYYQPHYRIPMYEYGSIIQGSHFDIPVNKAQPVQQGGLYIAITSKVKHDCAQGNIIYICDDLSGTTYKSKVVYVKSKLTFYMKTVDGFNWADMCQMIKDGRLQIRRNNRDIPFYAVKVGANTYLWREILKPGNDKVQDLEEYIFSNKSFYVNKNINFYLRRQDPNGLYGLLANDADYVVPDLEGTKLDNSVADTYVEEDEAEC